MTMHKENDIRKNHCGRLAFVTKIIGFHTVILFFRLNGLLPCDVEVSSGKKIILSKLWTFYHLILIVILCYVNFWIGIPHLVANENAYESKLSQTLEVVGIGGASSIVITIWILFPVNRKRGIIFVEKIAMADSLAKTFYEKYYLKSFNAISLIVVSGYFVLWVPLMYIEWITHDKPIEWFFWLSLYCAPSFVMTMFIMQFALTIKLVQQRLKALNDAVRRHTDTRKMYAFIVTRMHINNAVIKDFDTWKTAHDELYEATIIISKFYSFPILLVLLHTYYGIGFHSFYMIKDTGCEHPIHWSIANGIIWNVILIAPIVMLMVQIELLIDEAKKRANICCKFILYFSDNRAFRSQIKLYSQQLLHQNFNFTAFGCFPLNGTLLRSIFTTTVTYLVILNQLK